AYAACSTMFLSLPADVFHTRAVASVSGLAGTGAGIGVLISTYLIGRVTDRFSFQPVIVAASIVPCVATMFFVSLVRERKPPDAPTSLSPGTPRGSPALPDPSPSPRRPSW